MAARANAAAAVAAATTEGRRSPPFQSQQRPKSPTSSVLCTAMDGEEEEEEEEEDAIHHCSPPPYPIQRYPMNFSSLLRGYYYDYDCYRHRGHHPAYTGYMAAAVGTVKEEEVRGGDMRIHMHMKGKKQSHRHNNRLVVRQRHHHHRMNHYFLLIGLLPVLLILQQLLQRGSLQPPFWAAAFAFSVSSASYHHSSTPKTMRSSRQSSAAASSSSSPSSSASASYTVSSAHTLSQSLTMSVQPRLSDDVRWIVTGNMNREWSISSTSLSTPSSSSTPPWTHRSKSSYKRGDHLVWFPWIPTRAQIDSLSLPELRQVCQERVLLDENHNNDIDHYFYNNNNNDDDDMIDMDKEEDQDNSSNDHPHSSQSSSSLLLRRRQLQQRLWEWTVSQQARLQRQRLQPLHPQQKQRLLLFETELQPPHNQQHQPPVERPDTVLQTPSKTTTYRSSRKIAGNPIATESALSAASSSSSLSLDDVQSPYNSLNEWVRNVDLQPLLNRREAIRSRPITSTTTTIAKTKTTNQKRTNHHRLDNRTSSNTTLSLNASPTSTTVSSAMGGGEGASHHPRTRTGNQSSVHQLYAAAKRADQQGNIDRAKTLLMQIISEWEKQDVDVSVSVGSTPVITESIDGVHMAQVYRRWARLEKDQGHWDVAASILQQGLSRFPRNAYLLHGMANMAAPTDSERKRWYRRAIRADPAFPHPYHAWGTLEHSQGNIAAARKILTQGIRHCPTSHRLHHALGDLYRDAKVLDLAETSYKKALQHGPWVSHGFAYNALAFVAYEQGNVDKCRSWLLKGIGLNSGRHANSWLSLSQLEEAEGNTQGARSVCIAAILQYEKVLKERYGSSPDLSVDASNSFASVSSTTGSSNAATPYRTAKQSIHTPPEPVANDLFLESVPHYRPGDRFYNVYRNWVRLEARYGTRESTVHVLKRATCAFPREWRLLLDWARYYTKLRSYELARPLYIQACTRVAAAASASGEAAARATEPYRLYAAFEMAQGNYKVARRILFQGASLLTQATADGSSAVGSPSGLPELLYTWAVCEWHLDDLNRCEVLLDHALRLTNHKDDVDSDHEEVDDLRCMILYTLARLHYVRGDYLLSQHCISLCLVDVQQWPVSPQSLADVWFLWADVAAALGNRKLQAECREQAQQKYAQTIIASSSTSAASAATAAGTAGTAAAAAVTVGDNNRVFNASMKRHVRREPWHIRIFGGDNERLSEPYLGLELPDIH